MNPNNEQMGPALAAAGGSLLSGIATSITSAINTNKTIRAQKEMAQKAWERDVEMWNMQNAYNTPAAQMARLKEAGLNPALMYQKGTTGQAGNAPRYNPPNLKYQYEAPDLSGVVPAYLTAVQVQKNIEKTEEERNLIVNKQATEISERILKDVKIINQRLDNKLKNATLDYQVDAVKASLDIKRRQLDKINKQMQLMEADRLIKSEVLKSKKLLNNFQSFKNKLMSFGVTMSDNEILRMFIMNMDQKDLEVLRAGIKDKVKKIYGKAKENLSQPMNPLATSPGASGLLDLVLWYIRQQAQMESVMEKTGSTRF